MAPLTARSDDLRWNAEPQLLDDPGATHVRRHADGDIALLALVHESLAQYAVLSDEVARMAMVLDGRQRQGTKCATWPVEHATYTLQEQPSNMSQIPRVRLYCFGAFELSVLGKHAEACQRSKARALLSYLANHQGRVIARNTLMEALWPNTGAAAPDSSLNVAVHALRQFLLQLGVTPDVLTVETYETGYRLRAPSLWLDVDAFRHFCKLGHELEHLGQTTTAMASYTAAASLYQGDFLAGDGADWVVFRREALRDQYLTVLARLAALAMENGDHGECIQRCEQALEHEPFCEQTYRTLMLCHGRLGQRSRARFWHDRCLHVLQTELRAAPQPETERLYARVLRGETC